MTEPEPRGKVPATEGDRDEVMVALFGSSYSRLVRMAMLLVDDQETAEDVVMDAFVGLRLRWRFIRDPHDGFRYLRSSVLNGARSKLRRRRVARLLDQRRRFADEQAVESSEVTALRRHQQGDLAGAVRALPTRQREVIVLRYYLDMSEAEIADELSISRGAVKSHAARAIRSLAVQQEVSR